MFPGVEDNCFTILNGLSGNGGGINAADVVSFIADGRMQLGELMVAVGVSRGSVYDSHAIISMWSTHPESADVAWPKYVVSRDNVKVVPVHHVDTVFTYRMSADRSSCVVYAIGGSTQVSFICVYV